MIKTLMYRSRRSITKSTNSLKTRDIQLPIMIAQRIIGFLNHFVPRQNFIWLPFFSLYILDDSSLLYHYDERIIFIFNTYIHKVSGLRKQNIKRVTIASTKFICQIILNLRFVRYT